MKTQRRTARNLAFQTLFELELRPGRGMAEALKDRVVALEEEEDEKVDTESYRFASDLVAGTLGERRLIDEHITRVAPSFPVEQLPNTDRVALELAVYELVCDGRAPIGAVINEAVELAKTYGGESSSRFVNGVLGTIAEELAQQASPTRDHRQTK